MHTVMEIINAGGGFARFKEQPLCIENGEHPLLLAQYCGQSGVGGADVVRVLRLENVEEELVRTLEMSFEVNPDGSFWRAVVWHCGLTDETRFVYTPYEIRENQRLILINMDESRVLRFRANAWDEQLRELGYIDAAREMLFKDCQMLLFNAG